MNTDDVRNPLRAIRDAHANIEPALLHDDWDEAAYG
jgi:hypothetical protein